MWLAQSSHAGADAQHPHRVPTSPCTRATAVDGRARAWHASTPHSVSAVHTQHAASRVQLHTSVRTSHTGQGLYRVGAAVGVGHSGHGTGGGHTTVASSSAANRLAPAVGHGAQSVPGVVSVETGTPSEGTGHVGQAGQSAGGGGTSHSGHTGGGGGGGHVSGVVADPPPVATHHTHARTHARAQYCVSTDAAALW